MISGSDRVALGRTGLNVSPIGFGTYRVSERVSEHRAALRQALLAGCNLVDTSTNYQDGASERAVGATLSELVAEGRLRREDIVVVTKAGYVQGGNLEAAQRREAEGRPFPEMVKFQPGCWHCISPEFLRAQLDESLARLRLDRVDVLLLHNPEYFLKAGGDHAEYYRRIGEAFAYLETEAERGRISWYGISSNTFPEPREADDYTSLETVIELAERIGAGHRFGVIQLPFNLLEPGAAFENNNSGKSVLELAQAKGLGVLANRPLNAFHGNRLVRLASFRKFEESSVKEGLEGAFQAALALEARYPRQGSPVPLREIAWAHILKENLPKVMDLDTWRSVLQYRIEPALADADLALQADPSSELARWARSHRLALIGLFDGLTAYIEGRAGRVSAAISEALDAAVPELRTSTTLSGKALRVYRSVPGIDCVLVGMRRPAYVEDALRLEPKLTPEQAFEALDAVPVDRIHELTDAPPEEEEA